MLQALKLKMIELLYADYNLFPIFLDVVDQGHCGASRPRVYIIAAHKKRVTQVQCVFELYRRVTKSIRKHVRTSPSDYLISDHWEVMQEASVHAQKRKLKFSPTPRMRIVHKIFVTHKKYILIATKSQP